VTVLYPPHRQMPARLRVFVDWVVEVMSKQF
jgi:LysR family transcriptional regulator, regulator for bpeEF and oprC